MQEGQLSFRETKNRRSGRLFWELWTRKILTVGAPLPLWGTPNPSKVVSKCPELLFEKILKHHSECFMLSSSPEKELREIFASTRLKRKALCCRNDSSMRAIRTDLLLSR
jgi:hypothetical protein